MVRFRIMEVCSLVCSAFLIGRYTANAIVHNLAMSYFTYAVLSCLPFAVPLRVWPNAIGTLTI
jgi:hypothetical protein